MAGKTSIPTESLAKMESMWLAGDTAEEIAEEVNVHPNTVRHHARSKKWKRKGEEGPEYVQKVSEVQKTVVIADKVERSLQETEKYIQDSERVRMMILQFQGRMLKNRDPTTNELLLDKKEADLIFQYLKCCKISMETLTIGYMGKRKAFGMDEVIKNDVNVLPWED